MFGSEISLFLCTFDDPIYIKLEKLDIILTLTTHANIGKVLEELISYSQQEDVEFVRKSIRAIGRLAVVFEQHARACVDCLVSLIQSKIHYVVQECIVVSVNIFRRYPNQYENIITTICQSLNETLDDHRAKAAMVWILGEYSRMITNAAELIEGLFLEDFLEEATDVQLAILTASVKFFLLNPDEGQDMLSRVLTFATSEVDNPDLNDRAYMYMCLLTECPERAPDIVLSDSNPSVLKLDLEILEPRLVSTLVPLIGTLSVVYGKFPQEFVPTIRNRPIQKPPQRQAAVTVERQNVLFLTYEAHPPNAEASAAIPKEEEEEEERVIVTDAEPEVRGQFLETEDGQRVLQIAVMNSGQEKLVVRQIGVEMNLWGLTTIADQTAVVVDPGKLDTMNVIFVWDALFDSQGGDLNVSIVIETNRPTPIVLKCVPQLRFVLVDVEEGEHSEFIELNRSVNHHGVLLSVNKSTVESLDSVKSLLQAQRLAFVAVDEKETFFAGKTVRGDLFCFALGFGEGSVIECAIKSVNPAIAHALATVLSSILAPSG